MSSSNRRSSKQKSTKQNNSAAVREAMDYVFLGTKVIDELRILLRLAAPSPRRYGSPKLSDGSKA